MCVPVDGDPTLRNKGKLDNLDILSKLKRDREEQVIGTRVKDEEEST